MSNLTRKDIFERAARKLRAEFEVLVHVTHRGGEGNIPREGGTSFLNEHLPRRFSASWRLHHRPPD